MVSWELQGVLEYTQWRRFVNVMVKAKNACENSKMDVNDHFADVGKMIRIAKDGQRKIQDYKLSRYACYLIVQNSDPRKKIIAIGQTYFAIQTRRQEVRNAIKRVGGTLPEDQPTPEKGIDEIAKEQIKKLKKKKKLLLDE